MIFIRVLSVMLISSFAFAVFANPISSDKLFSSPTNSLVTLSPSGKYVIAYENKDEERYLNLIEVKKEKVVSSMFIGNDSSLNSYHWVNDEQLLLNIRIAGERTYLVGDIVNNQVSFTKIKTDGYLVDVLPERPNEILFTRRTSYNSNYYDLYLAPLKAFITDELDDQHKVEHNEKRIRSYRYISSYQRVIFVDYDNDKEELRIKHLPLEGGNWQTLIKLKEADYRIELLDLIGKDKIAVLTNKDSDKMLVREFDILSKEFGGIIYQHPKYDLTSAAFNKNGSLNYVEFLEAGLTRRFYFEEKKLKITKRFEKTFSGSEAYIIDRSTSGLLLLYVNGSTEPGQYYLYNQKEDVLRRLLSEYSELEGEKFSRTEVLTLTTQDNQIIEAYLNRPESNGLQTLLVMPHGGPIGVRDSDRFNPQVQYFTSRGFSVLRVNFRGSTGFGEAFRKQGVGEFGRLIEEDITLVEKAVSKKYQFKQRCSIGASYGGYSAAMLAIKHPAKYQCVVAAYGVYDLPLIFNASNYRSGEETKERLEKVLGEYSAKLKKISPVNLVTKLDAPILLIAGKKDDVADFEHSNRFKYLLGRANRQLETMFYKNTGHGHAHATGWKHELATTYDFILKSLHLDYPKFDSLSQKGIDAISNDFVVRAKYYYSGSSIEQDLNKSLQLYEKAANYGDAGSMFKLGLAYQYGIELEENIDKAMEYYLKASELDFEEAVSHIGQMYMEGESIQQDWVKAKEYIDAALKLDPRERNRIRQARFYCTAPAEVRDVEKCISMMEPSLITELKVFERDDALEEIKQALVWTVVSTGLSQSERSAIKSYILKAFELEDEKLTLEDISAGKFELKKAEKYGESDEFILVKASDQFTISKEEEDKVKYGVIFDVDIRGVDRYRQHIGMFTRWARIDESGNRSYRYNSMVYGTVKTKWQIFNNFENVTKPENWILEIYSIDNDLIYSKIFSVKPEHNSKTIANNLK